MLISDDKGSHGAPIYQHGLTLIPAWISKYMPRNVWDAITYPFPNFKSATVEVWELISNFIPQFIKDVITNPCWDQNQTVLVKGVTGGVVAG